MGIMARPLRIELAGGVYHVTSRGDRREMIYGDDTDRRTWIDLFGEVCERFNWRCHAWCQMGNHYHVVVETAEANLSRGMRQLKGSGVRSFICSRAVRGCELWGQVFHLLTSGPRMRVLFPLRS